MSTNKLLFVDTNILLDFYRSRSELGLKLLVHLEKVSDRIIVTDQLKMEFKKNRLQTIGETIDEIKLPPPFSRPGLFSESRDAQELAASIVAARGQMDVLKERLSKLLKDCSQDPVYRSCQRIFERDSDLVLTQSHAKQRKIYRSAFRRFILGCPPRKAKDTSIGDAINWEWMIDCARRKDAELVIVTRDSDYGYVAKKESFVNDYLRDEFAGRVSPGRRVLLYSKLSDALRHFAVQVSSQEEREEEEIIMHQEVRDRALLSGDTPFVRFMNSLPPETLGRLRSLAVDPE